ncbi:hypothetical protein Ea357_304 [Erwinia phage Ea35-70]|uniref:Uncharacterized protein n=2 Tax=Agricanvirus TaxID=1984776 RepID=W6ARQ0_9CAUD|nr:hypothetical protein Ea357_304 [Erwinia phage Ea35-70]AHI60458.1 hypothetical protein Ea357_304 [Erwinia phage Ea35-70]AUG87063.1 hypothetical protein MORTIMER_315 [Erwinia phage vB_EamM_Mortimer]
MSRNFSLTTLINLLQAELDWYSTQFPEFEADVLDIVNNTISGKLTASDFGWTYNRLISKFGLVMQDTGNPRARFLRCIVPNCTHGVVPLLQSIRNYGDQHIDRDHIMASAVEILLGNSVAPIISSFYKSIKQGGDTAPWEREGYYELLYMRLRNNRHQFPSGFQVLQPQPRLTDELSTEIYRRFDEIVGALEKFNSDPQYASENYTLHGLQDPWTHAGTRGDTMAAKLCRAIDGERPHHYDEDEDEELSFNLTPYNPEADLVSTLNNVHHLQPIVKAIVSAAATKESIDERYPFRQPHGVLQLVQKGYFDGLTPKHLNEIYSTDLTIPAIHNVLSKVTYYSRDDHAQLELDQNGNIPDRQINPVITNFNQALNRTYPTNIPLLTIPMPVAMNEELDFAALAKTEIRNYNRDGYLWLLLGIVFDISKMTVTYRRQLNRIKGVPLRKVWELPLIVTPHRTIEEIFADLGYEILEVTDPNAKTEAPVRKPGGKRK